MTGVIDMWRAWRMRCAQDALADAEHRLGLWGHHFGTRPSERRAMERAVERAQKRVDALTLERGGVDAEFLDALTQARDVLYRQGCSDGAIAVEIAIERLQRGMSEAGEVATCFHEPDASEAVEDGE